MSASTAAACEIELGFDVECDWILPSAATSSGCATAQPRRQPVIANVFDIEFTAITVSGYSSNHFIADECFRPS